MLVGKESKKIALDQSFGVDVAVRRADDLDKLMIADAAVLLAAKFLDIGSGAGGQSARLAAAGALVHAVDMCDFKAEFAVLRAQIQSSTTQLQFTQGDIRDVILTLPYATYTAICWQRALHYLPYNSAANLLTQLSSKIEGRLYLSVTGLDSAIGKVHPKRNEEITKRFAALPASDAALFCIRAPLVVHTKDELVTLLNTTGWTVEKIWVSAFGNIKVVASSLPRPLGES